MSNGTVHQNLDDLFCAPSLPPSQLSPQRLPGANRESLAALLDVLKDNHERYHVFLNFIGFHNHITHRALAIYAVGGPAAVIRDYYERDGTHQRSAFESPGSITEQNFVDHLEDEKYYQAYVAFFSKEISEKGVANTIEEFIFSEKYNFQKDRDANAQPEMLARFYSGAIHPLIHVGYGLEFGLKGMLVEGLAMAAVHNVRIRESLPSSLFAPGSTNVVDNVANRLSSLALDMPAVANTPSASKAGGVHAFDLVARMLKDNRFSHATRIDIIDKYYEMLNKYSPLVWEYVEHWQVDPSQPGEVERKIEELIWLNSLFYGVGGLTPKGFQADFFLMHLVTSSLFLPSLVAYLSPRSKALLLRGYIHTALMWWVMRGRPALNIQSFLKTTSVVPSIQPTPASVGPHTTETTPTPNPFLPVLQSAITHPNDHLVKIQRAFAHFDTLYGRRAAGYFAGTELGEDAAALDGSLFVRNALLTADYVGWVREGQEARPFSQEGFF